MAADGTTPEELTQNNASGLQQPRNDLQPTVTNPQAGQSANDSQSSLQQNQLTDGQLRVGDSTTTVQNTTKTSMTDAQGGTSGIWLWLIILIVAVVALFWLIMKRRPAGRDTGELVESVTAAVAAPKPNKTVKKKSTAKKRSAAKRKGRK